MPKCKIIITPKSCFFVKFSIFLHSKFKKIVLGITEKILLQAVEQDENFWNHVDKISVFARMSPQGKADVIRNLQNRAGRRKI